jgi:hypothetical protein
LAFKPVESGRPAWKNPLPLITSKLLEGENTMFTPALKKVFSPSTIFVLSGGFAVWGGLLVTMMIRTNATGVVSVAF